MRASSVLALIVGLAGALPAQAEAELASVFHWQRAEPYFGGMSGIDVTEDGGTYVAVGDDGQVLTGRIERTDGRITGATSRWIGGLRTSAGQRVDGALSDSEGVALLPDGSFYVSFEQRARIWKYADWEAAAYPLPLGPGFDAMSRNAALEAVAVDRMGRVFTIPERAFDRDLGHPVYVYEPGKWALAGRVSGGGAWRVVGADIDDAGRLYVLERRVALPFGFASRVRRFALPFGTGSEEVILETRPGTHDNLEGLAVWTDADGRLHLLMISDDNYRSFQRTELVEYRLAD